MITISEETWADLHTTAASPIAQLDIPELLKQAVLAGYAVWLTDETGVKLRQFYETHGQLRV